MELIIWEFYKFYKKIFKNPICPSAYSTHYIAIKSCTLQELNIPFCMDEVQLFESETFLNNNQYINLKINTGLKWNHKEEIPGPNNNPGPNIGTSTPSFTEMLVDWVKVEQKVDFEISGDKFICGAPSTYTIEGNFAPWHNATDFRWSVSGNLEIIDNSLDGRSITVSSISGGRAEIKITIPNEFSCYDLTLSNSRS